MKIRQKRRQREIKVERLEEFRIKFGYSKKEMADFLEISYNQLNNYYKCGRLPASRYYGLLKGYLQAVDEEAADKKARATALLM